MAQTYEQAGFRDIIGMDFGLASEWFVADLTIVTASVDCAVEEATSGGATGHRNTYYQLGIAHELQRNIILSNNTPYTDIAFGEIARDDEIIAAVQYLVSCNTDFSLR